MDLQDIEDFTKEFPDASQFTQKLQTMQSQLPAILADFQNAYVLYNTDQNNQEYKQSFENIKNNLNSLNAQLFTVSNTVQSDIDKINSKLFALDVLIKKERKRNKSLKRKLGIIEDKSSATSEMILNYKEIYQSKYLSNWALFLSIIFVIVTITKIYGKPKVGNLQVPNLPNA
jgi:chromosome segregation ATPase